MKVYEVWVDESDYDECDGLVIVAEDKDRALEMVNRCCWGRCYFKKHQGEIHIDEVDLTKEHVVLESFR